MKKVELLAPAGNMECLKAAVNAGCDAVYLGLQSFSARAFAGNFSHEELKEAIAYCHVRGVHVYCTINTMLSETEIENAKKEVDFLYENDCDALLIQDLGLFHYVRTCYPDFPVHCSTQMHIHNLKGVSFMKEEGVERVVLARETPIEIIREACKTGVEIEVFVYGAICISYSGQCLMSSAMKNRSANKGMCAQCCRLRYFKEDGSSFDEGDYILSAKDLNTIDRIPELIDAGVSSLKIEGRMKRKEYVYLVVKTFREAIDHYYEGKEYHVSKERLKDLALMFNREFSNGHIFHDDVLHRMNAFRPNHQGIEIGKVLSYRNGRVQVRLTDTLFQHDGLRIINEPHDTGLTAVKIYKNDKLVSRAEAGDIVWLECKNQPVPKKGQALRKTTDTKLIEKIDRLIEEDPVLMPVNMEYDAHIDKPFIIRVSDEDGHTVTVTSENVIEEAKKTPTNHDTISRSLLKTGEYPYLIEQLHGSLENVFIPVSVLNQTRRDALCRLNEERKVHRINQGRKEYACTLKEPSCSFKKILAESDTMKEHADVQYLKHEDILPVIDENNERVKQYDHVLISSVCDLNNSLHDCIASLTLNLANSYALAYVLQKGCAAAVFSSELSNAQIRMTLDAFRERYGFVPCTYRLVYGRRIVMYIKDGFYKDHSLKSMTDLNGEKYDLLYNNGITMIREPHVYVEKNPYCCGSYLILDNESEEQEEILEEAYEEIFGRI